MPGPGPAGCPGRTRRARCRSRGTRLQGTRLQPAIRPDMHVGVVQAEFRPAQVEVPLQLHADASRSPPMLVRGPRSVSRAAGPGPPPFPENPPPCAGIEPDRAAMISQRRGSVKPAPEAGPRPDRARSSPLRASAARPGPAPPGSRSEARAAPGDRGRVLHRAKHGRARLSHRHHRTHAARPT